MSEIMDDLVSDSSNKVDNGLSVSDPKIQRGRLDVLLWLPINSSNLAFFSSIEISNKFEISIKTTKYGLIRSRIHYRVNNEEIVIEWGETEREINQRLREKASEDTRLIEQSLFSVLNTNENRLIIFIDCLTYHRGLDPIIEFIRNEDESDISDISDVSNDILLEPLSVSEAMKNNSGYVKVKGSIVSISEPFKMVQSYRAECKCMKITKEERFPVPLFREPKVEIKYCDNCRNTSRAKLSYVNAISLELQDDELFSDIQRLVCIILDTDTANIKIGERVEIRGSIHIINKNQKGNLIPVLFSPNLIDYPNKKDVSINSLDEEAIKRFAKMKGESVISELVELYDKTVIGSDTGKKALLLSLVSSGDDTNHIRNNRGNRNRIHTLLVGPPGLAKSSLVKTASKIIPNSRYESSQHSSGKSLTAIVEKEYEHHSLRLGPIPLAKNSVCALNEIGTIPFEEQKYLLDPMEEGEFTINKYGINSTINSPTTIIASANLLNSSYDSDSYNGNIQLNQIPCTPPVRDRFDLIAVVSEETQEDAILDYADKRIRNLSKRVPNYEPFLQKYIQYARAIEPVLDPNCIDQIKYYYCTVKKSNPGIGSNRVLETLIRLCRAIAKLKLKQVIDENDVSEAIEFHNRLLSKYVESTNVPLEPDKQAYEKCLEILKSKFDSKEPSMRYEELLYEACISDAVVRSYICNSKKIDRDNLKIDTNHKARQVKDLLVNNPIVRTVNRKPLTLQIDYGMKKQQTIN